MSGYPRPNIVYSACLEFDQCRYDGNSIPYGFLRTLSEFANLYPVCPEVAIGLGTPRDPVRLVRSSNDIKLIQPSTDTDLTEDMKTFSSKFLVSLEGTDGFILKSRSPSCGLRDARLYKNSENNSSAGNTNGMFAQEVVERFPHLPVEHEGRLTNLAIREHFLTRIFSNAAVRKNAENLTMHNLIRFHSRNKLLLMAHNQKEMTRLGRLTSNNSKENIKSIYAKYRDIFTVALSKNPTRGRYINVIQHAAGYFSEKLTKSEKKFYQELIASYSEGRIPLSSLQTVLRSWIVKYENSYLEKQSFFEPFPPKLITSENSAKR